MINLKVERLNFNSLMIDSSHLMYNFYFGSLFTDMNSDVCKTNDYF